MNKKDIVIQHNDLISGRHNWSTNEIKIVLNAITRIKEDSLTVSFSRKEISSFTMDENSSSSDLKNLSKKLSSKIFEIQGEKNGDWTILTWFSKIEYKRGEFFIKFNDEMTPYLLNLKQNFTKFNIQNILPMKSNYSMRIYQLLKQYQRIGSRSFTVDELRETLKVPTSYQYNHVKKHILLKAQEEMEEYSDIIFDFEEIKTGKRITSIKFNIIKKEEHEDIIIENQEDNPWYFDKYHGMNIEAYGIEYEKIKEIKSENSILNIKFENGDSIKIKDEKTLEAMIIK